MHNIYAILTFRCVKPPKYSDINNYRVGLSFVYKIHIVHNTIQISLMYVNFNIFTRTCNEHIQNCLQTRGKILRI